MRRLFLALTVASIALLPAGAAAQQGTADMRGRVLDSQGAVLPGVTIVLRDQDTGNFREMVSNADGTYVFAAIRPGRYEIAAELTGFKKYSRGDLIVEVGKTMTLDVQLEVGGVEETVTVTGESPIVDTTSKEVGGNITARELVDLPSINRNFIGFVGLLPGIIPTISTESFGSDSVNVNGLDARNNNYLLDGANNNDDAIGQRAGTQARTPLESIQEFQVLTNQFDAEFGRSTGAIINAVTKQGTNAYRGSAFMFFQDASLTNRDYFAIKNDSPKPDTSRKEFGGTIGGPIVRDKMHFFGSLERVIIDEGVTINIPVRPDYNTTTTEATRVWNTVVRFDHQISPNHTWGIRWLREYSPQFNQIIGTATLDAAREEDDLDQTVVWTLSSVLSNTHVNTLRAAFTQEDVAFANPCFNGNGRQQIDCEPTLAFQNYTGQQSSVAQDRVNNAYQIEDTLSWFLPGRRGDHDLKVGLQYQYVEVTSNAHDNLNGTFSFGRSNADFTAANPFTYPDRLSIRVPGIGHSVVKAHYIAGFVQDKWKMSDRLTLSLGLRYDLEVLPTPGLDVPELGLSGDSPTDTNNIGPRFGFSYDLGGEGRSVLRGGYGMFYDKSHFDLGITNLFTGGVYSDSFTVNFPANAADPGPRNGQLPTDPFLVNGPTVNRALLEQLYPSGSLRKNTGTVSLDNPDRIIPASQQLTVGFERQLAPNLSASADYVHVMARDVFMSQDLNPGLRAQPVPTSPLVRIHRDVFTAAANQLINVGETDYDSLMVAVEKRFSRNWSTRVAYTLAYARGNTGGVNTQASRFQLLDDLRLDLNDGPTDVDRRHNFVVSGSVLVPKTGGLTVSWVARVLSGSPFTIFNSTVDEDRNGNQTEPLAEGSYSGEGEDSTSADFDGGRNGAYGPTFFQLDARFGYRIRLGSARSLDIFGEVFNLTDRTNFGNPSGDISSANFLRFTGYRDGAVPRTGQFGIRFGF